MATIFSSGFETGNFNEWSWTTRSPTAESTSPFIGTYNAKARCTDTGNPTDVGFGRNDLTPQDEIWGNVRMRLSENLETFSWHVITIASGANGCVFRVISTGAFQLLTNWTVRSSTANVITMGLWYQLQFHVYLAGASTQVDLKALGETVTDTTNYATANITELTCGVNCNAVTPQTCEYDHIILDDAGYPTETVQTDTPSSDVSDGNWETHDPGSSSNLAAQIDESTIDKADYIQSQIF